MGTVAMVDTDTVVTAMDTVVMVMAVMGISTVVTGTGIIMVTVTGMLITAVTTITITAMVMAGGGTDIGMDTA
jgi:hypothetical protein